MTSAAFTQDFRHPRPRPRPGAPLPRVLAVTIARYREQFEERRGPLWDWFRARSPALYDQEGRPGDRRRGLRTDGADSMLCVIVTLLSSMDIRRGFLGRPPAGGEGKWHRRSVSELFGFAFGEAVPGQLSQRRIERHLRALATLGILQTHQLRTRTPRGFESKTAIRHVTGQLFRLAGTLGQLAKERREAFQRAAAERAAAAQARRIETVRMDQRTASDGSRQTVNLRSETAGSHGAARAGPPTSAADLVGRLIAPLRR